MRRGYVEGEEQLGHMLLREKASNDPENVFASAKRWFRTRGLGCGIELPLETPFEIAKRH